MAKNSIRDFDNTASNNTDIQSVDISEGCSPAGINNAIREVMADLADVNDGTVALESPKADSLSTDTISEKTSDNGVVIDSVTLKDGEVGTTSSPATAQLSSINGGQIGGRRNFIYNGAMTVNQRGDETGHSGVAYILDRWEVKMFNTGSGTVDVSQNTDAPNGFFQSMKVETNVADTTQDTNAQFFVQQQIEAQDINHFKFYESSPDSVTISFWVKSNLTGSFPMALKLSDNNSADNNTNTRIYNTTYSISTADTWEKKTTTITLDSSTSETKPTGNNFGMALVFWLAAGSNRDGANADVWEGNGNATIAADNLDLLANAANEWYVTGVQIEKGSTATEFEHRSFGEELALCQRYCIVYGGDSIYDRIATGHSVNTTNWNAFITLPVEMRTGATESTSADSHFALYHANTVTALTTLGVNYASKKTLTLSGSVASGLTTGRSVQLLTNATTNARLTLDAEL